MSIKFKIETFDNLIEEVQEFDSQRKSIFNLINKHTNNELDIRKNQIASALLSRMKTLNINSKERYYHYINNNQKELDLIISLSTNHSTNWFRHIEHFYYLEDYIKKEIKENKKDFFKFLSIPCSTGQEPYSISLLMNYISKENNIDYNVDAHDIDIVSINEALEAIYKKWSLREIPNQYHSFFTPTEERLKLANEITKKCNFSRKNICDEPFNTEHKYDIIFMRYILMYFNSQNIKKIINNISKVAKPNSLIFLGEKESISDSRFIKIERSIYRFLP